MLRGMRGSDEVVVSDEERRWGTRDDGRWEERRKKSWRREGVVVVAAAGRDDQDRGGWWERMVGWCPSKLERSGRRGRDEVGANELKQDREGKREERRGRR